jgi:hypothetical protein
MEAAYGQPTLLVETFTDPARHRGTCYQAANFLPAGETSGYRSTKERLHIVDLRPGHSTGIRVVDRRKLPRDDH